MMKERMPDDEYVVISYPVREQWKDDSEGKGPAFTIEYSPRDAAHHLIIRGDKINELVFGKETRIRCPWCDHMVTQDAGCCTYCGGKL